MRTNCPLCNSADFKSDDKSESCYDCGYYGNKSVILVTEYDKLADSICVYLDHLNRIRWDDYTTLTTKYERDTLVTATKDIAKFLLEHNQQYIADYAERSADDFSTWLTDDYDPDSDED